MCSLEWHNKEMGCPSCRSSAFISCEYSSPGLCAAFRDSSKISFAGDCAILAEDMSDEVLVGSVHYHGNDDESSEVDLHYA